jgi:hypothetical protein
MARTAASDLDTQRFGIPVLRADDVTAGDVGDLVAWSREQGGELLIARCDGADHAATRTLLAAGFDLVEGLVVYRGPLRREPPEPHVREAVPADAGAVAELAREGFAHYGGHYHVDPRLPLEACREAYVDWAVRGVLGEAADAAFVAEAEGTVAAFGIWTAGDGDIAFQLSSVAARARGLGLYRAILRRGMAWGLDGGATTMTGIVAHGTTSAHRNLIAEGLRPEGGISTFHGWRERLS